MTKTEYAEVLKSDRWQALRKEVLHNQPYCDNCWMPRWLAAIAYDQDLHVHHKSYANRGTDNEYDDLRPLCRRCHDIETFGRSDLKAPKTARCILCGTTHWNLYADRCEACTGVTGASEEAYRALRVKHDMGHGDGLEPLWAYAVRTGVTAEYSVAGIAECVLILTGVLCELHQRMAAEIELDATAHVKRKAQDAR